MCSLHVNVCFPIAQYSVATFEIPVKYKLTPGLGILLRVAGFLLLEGCDLASSVIVSYLLRAERSGVLSVVCLLLLVVVWFLETDTCYLCSLGLPLCTATPGLVRLTIEVSLTAPHAHIMCVPLPALRHATT